MNRSGKTDAFSTDEDLLAAYAAGNRTASREIVDRYAGGVFRLAVRILGNQADAEEITQEVMVRLWKVAPNWQAGKAKVSTWLWKVTANLCTDRIRRARFSSQLPAGEIEDDRPAPVDTMMDNARSRELYRVLAELPARQRIAVLLRHIEGRSNPEIAEILDTTVEAVESLLARGLRELKARLLPRRDELGWKS